MIFHEICFPAFLSVTDGHTSTLPIMSATASFRFNVPYRTLRARLCPPSSHVGCGSALSARSSRLRDLQFVRDHPGRHHRFSVQSFLLRFSPLIWPLFLTLFCSQLRATPVNPMGVQRWFKSNSFSLGIVSPAHDQVRCLFDFLFHFPYFLSTF
jgi:hypothetical protein